MAGRRCRTCSIDYPIELSGSCPVCDEVLVYSAQIEPEWNWVERAATLRKRRGDHIQWDGVHPRQTHPVTLMADDGGRLFLSHKDLLDMGYSSLESFSIVRVGNSYFELQGFDYSRKSWWVEPVGTVKDELEPEEAETSDGDE